MNRILISMALLASFSAACFADVTGKWIGKMKPLGVMPPSSNGVKVVNMGPTYTLTLAKDGTYTMLTANSKGKGVATDGKWSLKGTELSLTPSADSKAKSGLIKDRKLKVGPGEKSLILEFKVQYAVVGAASSGNSAPKPTPSKGSETTLTIEFKRA
jgi:hypothetical protein